jgi:hypothetical protein
MTCAALPAISCDFGGRDDWIVSAIASQSTGPSVEHRRWCLLFYMRLGRLRQIKVAAI